MTALDQILAADTRLLKLLRTRGHRDPRVEQLARTYSRSGEHAACWFALGATGLTLSRSPGRRRAWAAGLGAVAVAYGLNYAIKLTVHRSRPVLDDLPPLSSVVSRLSFPSAHATTSFAAAGVYSRALPPGRPLFYTAAVLFGVSRPYLGVHYPSDVLAGAVLGSVLAKVWPR